MTSMSKPAPSNPTIGYPEQRRMLKNTTPCYVCRRELEQVNSIKCVDCPKIFCSQCGKCHPSADGQSQIWCCVECSKRRQTLPPSLVPPAPNLASTNGSNILGHQTGQFPLVASNSSSQQLGQVSSSLRSSSTNSPQVTKSSQQPSQQFDSNYPNQPYYDQSSKVIQQPNSQFPGNSSNNMVQCQPSATDQFGNPTASNLEPSTNRLMGQQPNQNYGPIANQDRSSMNPDMSNNQSDPFAALSFPPQASSSASQQQAPGQQYQQFQSTMQDPMSQQNQRQQGDQFQQRNMPAIVQGNPGPYSNSAMSNPQLSNVPLSSGGQSVAPNEAVDYGYLDFEIDEEYERHGEYDDEEDEDEEDQDEDNQIGQSNDEDLEDEEDDDEDKEYEDDDELYQNSKQHRAKKEMNFVQQTIQRNAKDYANKKKMYHHQLQQQQLQRMSMPSAGYHHGFSGFHGTINNVYTIPEEDEEHEAESETLEQRHYNKNASRKASVCSTVTSTGNQFNPDQSGQSQQYSLVRNVTHTSSASVRPGSTNSPGQRMLPSASNVITPGSNRQPTHSYSSSSSSSSFSVGPPHSTPQSGPNVQMLDSTSSKVRSYRSNSEPFLQISKPLKRVYDMNMPGVGGPQMQGQQTSQQPQHQQQQQQHQLQQQQMGPVMSNQMMGQNVNDSMMMMKQQPQQQPQQGQQFQQDMNYQNMCMLQGDMSMGNTRQSGVIAGNNATGLMGNNVQSMCSSTNSFNNPYNQQLSNQQLTNQLVNSNQMNSANSAQGPINAAMFSANYGSNSGPMNQPKIQQQMQKTPLNQNSAMPNQLDYNQRMKMNDGNNLLNSFDSGLRQSGSEMRMQQTANNDFQQKSQFEQANQFSMPRSMPLYNMANQFCPPVPSSGPSTSMGLGQHSHQGLISSSSSVTSSISTTSTVSLLPTSSIHRTQPSVSQSSLTSQSSLSNRAYSQSQQQPSKSSLQQFQESSWSHSTELSPILDVSPSIEAAEAQEILERANHRRRSTDNEPCSTNTTMGIPRATSGTISGMIDDFNRAIETLSLTNNADEIEANIRARQDSQQKKYGSLTAKSIRRASTGQVDSLDQYRQNHNLQQQLKQQQQLQKKAADSLAMISQASQDLEALRQQKALINSNTQLEQQLQKQQQILIQQQQQFLQIQLEQQRLQTQLQEQLSTAAKMEQHKPNSETRTIETATASAKSQQRLTAAEANKEIAINTEISFQDSANDRLKEKCSVSSVMKQDKQVSTSITPPPSSLNSTPTGPVTRYHTGGQTSTAASSRMSGIVDADQMRPRVASASSSSSSLHRRLPQPMSSEEPYSGSTGYHHHAQQQSNQAHQQHHHQSAQHGQHVQHHQSRPSSSVTATSISQRSNSPLMTRKQLTRNLGAAKGHPVSSGSTTATAHSTSILSKKNASTGLQSTSTSYGTTSLNTLGYLDLDTKNVTFEGAKGKRRKLPTVPKDEEPISSMISTRKLIKDRLSGRNTSTRNVPPLKSSSSLDSSFGIGPSSYPGYSNKRPQSPFSSNSDITHFLASTYGRNILKSPTSSSLVDTLKGKDKQRSNTAGKLAKSSMDDSLITSTNFADEIKNIQQKIMEELKTGDHSGDAGFSLLNNFKPNSREIPVHDRSLALAQSNFSGSRNLYGDLIADRNKRDAYNDQRYSRRNASETRINNLVKYGPSLAKGHLPFKSYEYESLNPVRYSDNKYRLTRPMSSVSFYENDLGLRESLIPNCMNSNEDELFVRSSLFDPKRSLDKDILSSKYDRINSLYSKYDLATGLVGSRYSRRNDLMLGRDHRNASRSWHPSPYVSDVSDEEDLERELSVEEKTAKVRAEIKRRRQRLADSGRLYRHYSFDDYNILSDYSTDFDPLMSDALNSTSYGLRSDQYRKSKYFANEYPLSGSKEKYYSDDLDAYYSSKGSAVNPYDYLSSRHNTRLYDSRLTNPNYGYPSEDYTQHNSYATSSMPLLSDSVSRPRKFADDVGANVNGTGYRSGYDLYDYNYIRGSPKKTQFAPNSTKHPKYSFPIKRILLTQDPKIRSMGGDGLGMKVVGGKDIPGTNMIGAYIQKIHPSLSMNGEIREGMQVIEWNGIPLTGISHDEVSRIIANQIGDEIEVVIRTDINLLQGQYDYHAKTTGHGQAMAYGGPNAAHYDQTGYYGQEPGMSSVGHSYYQPQQPPHHQQHHQSQQSHYPTHIAPSAMHPGTVAGGVSSMHHVGKHHQSTVASQPQVILQHNHPIDENMMYDQYGKMIPPGPHVPAVGSAGAHHGPHHHPGLMHQHVHHQPPQQTAAPPPSMGQSSHHHNQLTDNSYYPH